MVIANKQSQGFNAMSLRKAIGKEADLAHADATSRKGPMANLTTVPTSGHNAHDVGASEAATRSTQLDLHGTATLQTKSVVKPVLKPSN